MERVGDREHLVLVAAPAVREHDRGALAPPEEAPGQGRAGARLHAHLLGLQLGIVGEAPRIRGRSGMERARRGSPTQREESRHRQEQQQDDDR